jgi:hypothetical protein
MRKKIDNTSLIYADASLYVAYGLFFPTPLKSQSDSSKKSKFLAGQPHHSLYVARGLAFPNISQTDSSNDNSKIQKFGCYCYDTYEMQEFYKTNATVLF